MAARQLLHVAVVSQGEIPRTQLSMQNRGTGSAQWRYRGVQPLGRPLPNSCRASDALIAIQNFHIFKFQGFQNVHSSHSSATTHQRLTTPGFQDPVCACIKPIGEETGLVDQQMPSGPGAWQPCPRLPACFCDVSACHPARCSIAAGPCRFTDALAPSADPACCQPASAQPYSLGPLLPHGPCCLTLGVTHCQQLALYKSGPSASSLQLPD